MASWGPLGPIERKGLSGSWFNFWRKQIQRHITDKTSLPRSPLTTFKGIRRQLETKHLEKATLYFVVESVRLSRKSLIRAYSELSETSLTKFQDYCWFKSSPVTGTCEVFECSKDSRSYPMDDDTVVIKWGRDHKRKPVPILDVLTYTSSAWAGAVSYASVSRKTTKKLWVSLGDGKHQAFRLIDSATTFNDPLVPYMLDDKYTKSNHIQIWNFDFSYYEKGDKLGNMKAISVINKAMKRIGKPFNVEV
eukprot:882380_1